MTPRKTGAPVIVASGMGYMAEKITEAAMEAGVPVYEDDSLATLLSQMKLGRPSPGIISGCGRHIHIFPGICTRGVPEAQERSVSRNRMKARERDKEEQRMPNRWIKRTAAVILACCLAQRASSHPWQPQAHQISERAGEFQAGGRKHPARHRRRDRNPGKGKVMVSGGNSKYPRIRGGMGGQGQGGA